MQQILVTPRRIGTFDQIGVVAEDDRDRIERGEIALFVFVRAEEKLALWRSIGIDRANFLELGCLLGGAIGHIKQVVAGIHLGLNFDNLPVSRNAVGVHLNKGIAFAKSLGKR